MARTYPLSLTYGQCLGHEEGDPYAFSSLYLEDLRSGRKEYIVNIQQLDDALPKSLDPTSRFALRAQVTPQGHQCLQLSLSAALWWLLPSDGNFRRTANRLQYYLARQERRVVLRGGDITVPFHESRLYWIHDPAPSPPRRMEHTITVPPSDSSAPISSKSSVSIPSGIRVPIPSDYARSPDKSVSVRDTNENEASAIATHGSTGAPLTPSLPKKYRRRRRRQARRAANRNSAASLATPMTPDEHWANQCAAGHAGATQPQLEGSDPTSSKRTAVYPPSQIVGNSAANENVLFQLGLESSRFPGLYKPAVPDQQQDTTARTLRVKNSGSGISSPPYLLSYTKPFSGRPAGSSMTSPTREAGEALRSRSGIVYPLLPRAHRPDTRVVVDAALPEPAAVQRQELPPTVVEIVGISKPQTSPTVRRRASRKPSRKRQRNRSTAVFRPSKRSPPRGHWCD